MALHCVVDMGIMNTSNYSIHLKNIYIYILRVDFNLLTDINFDFCIGISLGHDNLKLLH